MTEQEQAERIWQEMYFTTDPKKQAMIAVDLVIDELVKISVGESGSEHIDYGQSKWRRIKEIIKNL